jgi:Fe2+ or Zn2+ uptake regulation protein
MTDKEHLRDKLHTANRRMTRQRQLVLDTLEKSHEHPDVDSLYKQVKAREPNISLATVYRTLTVLKEMGLIEEHRFGENHSHFEVAHAAPHYHFTCLKCGRVLEFESPQVMQVARQLSKREGLHITGAHLFLSGYCARCRTGGTKAKFNI